MVQVAAAQDLESVPNVCGGIAANTPTNVGVSFLGRTKGGGQNRSSEGVGSTSHASAPHPVSYTHLTLPTKA